MSRRRIAQWGAFVLVAYTKFMLPKCQLHVHGACSCTVVYLGGSYASGALSAFVRVSRHKTLCMYHLSHCFLLVFVFCLINIFSSSSSSFKFKFDLVFNVLYASFNIRYHVLKFAWCIIQHVSSHRLLYRIKILSLCLYVPVLTLCKLQV